MSKRRQRILKRAFILLFVLWLIDLISLISVIPTLVGLLGGYLALGVLSSFLTILILGLLVQELTTQ